jgi:hypothetical protein
MTPDVSAGLVYRFEPPLKQMSCGTVPAVVALGKTTLDPCMIFDSGTFPVWISK